MKLIIGKMEPNIAQIEILEEKIKELESDKNTKMDSLLIKNWKRSIQLINQQ